MAKFLAFFPLREKKEDVDEGAMTSQFYETSPNSGIFYSFNLSLRLPSIPRYPPTTLIWAGFKNLEIASRWQLILASLC